MKYGEMQQCKHTAAGYTYLVGLTIDILLRLFANVSLTALDQRNPPPLGRIPDPDDIIASIRVEDGKLITESYQAMPSYRLCTNDGVCQLTDGLMDRLKLVLSQVADAEQSSVSRT